MTLRIAAVMVMHAAGFNSALVVATADFASATIGQLRNAAVHVAQANFRPVFAGGLAVSISGAGEGNRTLVIVVLKSGAEFSS